MKDDRGGDADSHQHGEEASQHSRNKGHVLPMAWRIGE